MQAQLDQLVQDKSVASFRISKCSTTEDFDTLQNELKEEENFSTHLQKCKQIGGSNIKEMTSELLSSYMSKNLMRQYSLQGKRKKRAFDKTELLEALNEWNKLLAFI